MHCLNEALRVQLNTLQTWRHQNKIVGIFHLLLKNKLSCYDQQATDLGLSHPHYDIVHVTKNITRPEEFEPATWHRLAIRKFRRRSCALHVFSPETLSATYGSVCRHAEYRAYQRQTVRLANASARTVAMTW